MFHDRSSSRDGRHRAFAALEAAVPAQHEAKAALRNQFAVFRAQSGQDPLMARPVLLCANAPGNTPAALVRALAGEAGLPWMEVSAAHGLCIDQIVSQLARRAVSCREDRPLGVVLIKNLEDLPLAAAQSLASFLRSTDRMAHLHSGREMLLSAQQVFWVGSLAMSAPSRAVPRAFAGEAGASFAFLAVGPSAADVVAAGVAGPLRASSADAGQEACVAALASTFTTQAWLLPGTTDELTVWAGDESAAWWPGRRVRAYCERHGVAMTLERGAAEAVAAAAALAGGTLEAIESCFQQAMEPVFAILADPSQEIAAVELTAAAVALDENPRLHPGPRWSAVQRASSATPPGTDADACFERPPRTPQSPPETRLARAEDLDGLLDAAPEG